MRSLFESFGTAPVLTIVFVLQILALYAIFSGKIARFLRIAATVTAVPLLALVFCFFFCSPQDLGDSSTSHPNEDHFINGGFSLSGSQDSFGFQKVSSSPQEKYLKVANNSVNSPHNIPGTTLTPVAAPPENLRLFSSPNNSPDAVHPADYTASSSEKNTNAVPTSYQSESGALPPPSSLRIDAGTLELTEEKTSSLIDLLTQSRRHKIEETRPAVVHIEASVMKSTTGGKRSSVETGGGVIVKTGRGEYFVVTNYHVAGEAVSNEEVRIFLYDHRVIHPTEILPCPEFDLALLRLAEQNLTAAPLGNSDEVQLIDEVYAIGSPFGLEGSISSGIISGLKRRDLPLGNKNQFQNFLQTDAAINPGNSGGPLLNSRGQVIGIVTVIATKSGASEGVGLAIPINYVKSVASRLIREGSYRRPFIGLDLDRSFGAEQKAVIGLRRSAVDGSTGEEGDQFVGARVLHIKPNSPASAAGIREGDIIIAYNGQVVEDGEHFNHLVGLSTVDESASLDILRGRERLQIHSKLVAAH